MLSQLGTVLPYFWDKSNDGYSIPVPQLSHIDYFDPIIGRPLNYGDLIILFTFAAGIHFNCHNMIASLLETDTKCYALKATIPYIQFFIMLFASQYSRFWPSHVYLFVITAGLYLLYVTGVLNVCTMSGRKFGCFFYEPFLWLFIVYVDFTFTEIPRD